MEILINISEDKFKALQGLKKNGMALGILEEAVLNGRILPKGQSLINGNIVIHNLQYMSLNCKDEKEQMGIEKALLMIHKQPKFETKAPKNVC